MSDPAPCSCRLPWACTVVATLIAVTALAWPRTTPTSTPATAPEDPRVATLTHDLEEVRRVLNDAQSALGDRDREIAAANEELRILRARSTPTPGTP